LRSTSSSVTFMVPNGTYAFTAGKVSPYTAYPETGTVTVNGTAQHVNITYSKVVPVVSKSYNVTFNESGLPSGTSWSVTLNGTARTSVSSNTSFFLPNGTYAYTSGQVTGYSVSPASGTVTVNGTAQHVNITYSKVPTNVSIAPVNLGEASNFTILAESETTSTGNTSITGNVGLSPAAASFITGFGLVMSSNGQYATSTLVNGKVYAADYSNPTPAMLSLAVLDMQTAYTSAADRPDPKAVGLGNGNLGGMTITPGLYKWTTGVTIPSNLILDGNASSVWIFQISGGLTVGSGAQVILTGGAQAKNVFWQVGSGVTLGTDSSFSGIILSKTLIAMDSGSTLNGSALAQTAVTLIGNRVDSSGSGQGQSSAVNATYQSEFTESGLPSVTPWYVNITGMPGSGPITGDSFSVAASNGTYNYTVATSNNIYRSTDISGTFTINGTQSSVTVKFVPVKYKVTFTETGLPEGTAWYVNITGQNSSGKLVSSSYSVNLTNGSYAYEIIYPSYSSKDYSGMLTVNGSSVPLVIPFTLKSTASFAHDYMYDIIATIVTIGVLASALIVIRFHKR